MATNFLSPVGRFVQGDFFEAQTKDAQGNPRTVKTGPNAGQPAPQFFVAVAFAKNNPEWNAFYNLIRTEAHRSFPALFPQGPAGPCSNPNFSFKVVDGDGVDQTGKANNTKEGFAGHWIVRFASSFAPQIYPPGKYSLMDRITDKNMVRLGYYVKISGSIDGNGNAQRPGVYVNLSMAEFVQYGPEIVRGPDAATVFGAAPTAWMPPGASQFPLAAAPAAAPTQAPVASPTPAPAIASPTSAPPPYTAYMTPFAAAPLPPPPAAPSGPMMTPKANGVTYAQFIAGGWTEDQLRQNGYIM